MYFKILERDLTHNGYTYHEGLNVDPNPFDPKRVRRGGLFFTDEKQILGFCEHRTKIAEVIIPDGEKVVQIGSEYKAHRIILGEIKDLWNINTFEWLIKCGVDIHANDDDALCMAAGNGHLEVIKYLLKQGANIHAYDDNALRQASGNGHLEVVKYLIEKGANVHADDDYYALHDAVDNKYWEVVKYLVEQCINADKK